MEHIVMAVAKAAYALHEEYKVAARVSIMNEEGQVIGCSIGWPEPSDDYEEE